MGYSDFLSPENVLNEKIPYVDMPGLLTTRSTTVLLKEDGALVVLIKNVGT